MTYVPLPPSPMPTPPCGGEPWRLVDGTIECLTDTGTTALAASGTTDAGIGALLVGAFLITVGLVALNAAARASRRSGVPMAPMPPQGGAPDSTPGGEQ